MSRRNQEKVLGRRVDNLGANNHAFYDRTGSGSSTYDVCEDHARDLDSHPHLYDDILIPYNGEEQGEDGWGGDVEHPPYDEIDVICKICDVPLTDDPREEGVPHETQCYACNTWFKPTLTDQVGPDMWWCGCQD